MKRIFLSVIIAVVAFVDATAQLSGPKKSYVTQAPVPISSLKIVGDINVTLVVVSNDPDVYIQGDEDFTRDVKITNVNGELTITAYSSSKTDNDVVYVYAPDLELLDLNGNIQLKTIGTVNSKKMEVSISGNCKLAIQHTGKLNIIVDENYELTKKQTTPLKKIFPQSIPILSNEERL